MGKKWSKRHQLALVGAVTLLFVVAAVVSWVTRPLLSSRIRHEVGFAVLLPTGQSSAAIDRASIKYDSDNKILTYAATFYAAHLTVTNQAAPDVFNDVPKAYQQTLTGMHRYTEITSANGKVSLTRPPHTANQQVAVANIHGTLMFVRADKDLNEDRWRQFFNRLSVVK